MKYESREKRGGGDSKGEREGEREKRGREGEERWRERGGRGEEVSDIVDVLHIPLGSHFVCKSI